MAVLLIAVVDAAMAEVATLFVAVVEKVVPHAVVTLQRFLVIIMPAVK